MRRASIRAATSVTALAAAAIVLPAAAMADPPRAVERNASESELTFQPATDYDTDGCYPTPAMASDGTPAAGLKLGGDYNGHCHDPSDLADTNSYVRTMCVADGWCAHMYAYYFEKDQATLGPGATGHTHDIEHIVSWVKDGQLRYVAASRHGGYDIRPAGAVRMDGTHPKIVYHKDGGSTHAFRFANETDDRVENQTGNWHYPAPVSWEALNPSMRDTIENHSYGKASFDIRSAVFSGKLAQAKPAEVPAF